jgi:hypothetical protein
MRDGEQADSSIEKSSLDPDDDLFLTNASESRTFDLEDNVAYQEFLDGTKWWFISVLMPKIFLLFVAYPLTSVA